MRTFLRYALVATLSLGALAGLAYGGLAWFFRDFCDRRPVGQAPSPDGRWQAVTYVSSCGATESLVTQVDVFPRGRFPARLGRSELFRAVARSEYVPAGPHGEAPVSVAWAGPARLRIMYDGRLAVLVRDSAAAHGAVAVDYATKYWPNQP